MSKNDFRFDICTTVSNEVINNEFNVKNGIIPSGRCALVRHKGSYQSLADTVNHILDEWLPESGEHRASFPCYFHYVNLIGDVSSENELITDIYLPLT